MKQKHKSSNMSVNIKTYLCNRIKKVFIHSYQKIIISQAIRAINWLNPANRYVNTFSLLQYEGFPRKGTALQRRCTVT